MKPPFFLSFTSSHFTFSFIFFHAHDFQLLFYQLILYFLAHWGICYGSLLKGSSFTFRYPPVPVQLALKHSTLFGWWETLTILWKAVYIFWSLGSSLLLVPMVHASARVLMIRRWVRAFIPEQPSNWRVKTFPALLFWYGIFCFILLPLFYLVFGDTTIPAIHFRCFDIIVYCYVRRLLCSLDANVLNAFHFSMLVFIFCYFITITFGLKHLLLTSVNFGYCYAAMLFPLLLTFNFDGDSFHVSMACSGFYYLVGNYNHFYIFWWILKHLV